jgi:dipeptidyl aminopeptidase/acylaminoacyl peptidase
LGEEPGREREGPANMRLVAAAGGLIMLLPLTACGGSPPQIVDYSPQRGAVEVSTAAPIKITFDHAVDEASVESRLHLVPASDGTVQWETSRQLVYNHSTLEASTTYEVVLEPGYKDLAGNTYSLRHHWSFVTEGAPNLAGSTPSDSDTGVDPAAYISLNFTREMNATTLRSALTFNPSIPFDVRLDPTDGRRAVVAPSELLAPNTSYEVSVNTAALDIDGNQLGRDQTIRFTTGSPQALKGWLAFAVDGAGGAPGGLWIVNEAGFPRQLYGESAVHSFSWSPSGDRLLIQGDAETWSEFVPGGGATVQLNFKGTWAAALAGGMGYVYIDDGGVLHRQSADGTDQVISTDVAQAAVAPNGLRLAFVQGALAPDKVWGYDVGLSARYLLAMDSGAVSDITWAPSGNRIAYLRNDGGSTSLLVKNLAGAGTTATIASGDLGSPAWLPDSTHLVFGAAVQPVGTSGHKAFVVNVVAPPAALTSGAGVPSDPNVDLSSPVPSPDGHQIAFVSGNQVWLMNADGTRPIALTRFDPATFPYSCRALAWTKA